MAITNYSNLQTAIGNWLADDTLTTYVPDFITLFEAAFNRRLLTRQRETSTTLTPVSGSIALPTDYLGWRRVTWTGSPRQDLEYVEPSYFQAVNPTSALGTPSVFTIEGATLKVAPISGTALDFLYFQLLPVLSGTTTTNWLLTSHPDVYLFGSLVEATAFLKDEQRAAFWKLRRDEGIDELERLDRKQHRQLAMRPMGTIL